MFRLSSPIVFCTFNRYEHTMKVFSRIREAKPERLYFVSDGPRESVAGEADEVQRIRADIEAAIDWTCDLVMVFSDVNLGCAKRISSALDYVFEREDDAIILEDDCYPALAFFEYCQTLLDKYRDDERIMSIGGSTVIDHKPDADSDYFFSSVFCCCGWATWKRSWELFDLDMTEFPKVSKLKDNTIKDTLRNRRAFWAYMSRWRLLYNSIKKYSWAYIFFYQSVIYEKYNIIPAVNLIENIGFGGEATNTGSPIDYYVTDTKELSFPLRAPLKVEKNTGYDDEYFKITQKAGLFMRIKEILGFDINRSFFDISK